MPDADPIPQLLRLDLTGQDGYLNRGSWRLSSVATHTIALRAEARAQGVARTAMRGWLAGLPEDRIDDVVLLGCELVSNALRHAPGGAPREIRLHLARSPGVVRVEVCDGGAPFVPRLREPGPSGGFGLLLIDRIAHAWGAAPDPPSCVWFEVALPVPEPGAPA